MLVTFRIYIRESKIDLNENLLGYFRFDTSIKIFFTSTLNNENTKKNN